MNSKRSERIGLFLLGVLALAAAVALFLKAPIKQNQIFHQFVDKRILLGIPNFWNVISNVPFLIVGVMGLYKINDVGSPKGPYAFLFLGIALVSIGSGYYHLNPNDATLVWDRLPMTIGFMSLFTIVVSEFIDQKTGRKMLIPALVLGTVSILYWVLFNDLSVYVFVQVYPLLAIPVILLCFTSSRSQRFGYWFLFFAYLLAKVAEYYDGQVFDAIGVFSGHTLKHFLASIGLFVLLYSYTRQKAR